MQATVQATVHAAVQTAKPAEPAAEVAAAAATTDSPIQPSAASAEPITPAWGPDAHKELQKIPFFVRGKARRNTERFAAERGLSHITVETLYDAKAHYAR
jgi:light-independent protochlorophyllide reductase subunit B